jgi:hypothetical protein
LAVHRPTASRATSPPPCSPTILHARSIRIAKLPNNQRKLITEGQPVILEIVVTEAKSQESPPPNGSK